MTQFRKPVPQITLTSTKYETERSTTYNRQRAGKLLKRAFAIYLTVRTSFCRFHKLSVTLLAVIHFPVVPAKRTTTTDKLHKHGEPLRKLSCDRSRCFLEMLTAAPLLKARFSCTVLIGPPLAPPPPPLPLPTRRRGRRRHFVRYIWRLGMIFSARRRDIASEGSKKYKKHVKIYPSICLYDRSSLALS